MLHAVDRKASRFQLRMSARALVPLLLAGVLGVWIWLALGPWLIGPSDWDDTMYLDRAVTGAFVWDVRNRYVHVWAMRLVDLFASTHRSAAATWASVCVCGMAALAYYAAQRAAGLVAGVLAALLLLLFPPMLKYLSVPHVDFTMALFSMLAVTAAAYAVDSSRERSAVVAAVASGLFAYAALKSKETGLVIAPLCAYLLFGVRSRLRWRSYGAWLVGLALGFGLLFALDRAFLVKKEQTSNNPVHYFQAAPQAEGEPSKPAPARPAPAHRPPHEAELLETLLDPAFAAFTLLGFAGFARGARRSIWLQALGSWAIAVCGFTALISVRYRGVDAQDRYLIAAGAALAPLAACHVVSLWREPRPSFREALFFQCLLLVVAGVALWGLWGQHTGDVEVHRVRALQLTLPLGMLLLFLAGWLAPRPVAVLAACVLLAMSALLSIDRARAHREQKRHELEPWLSFSQQLDQSTPSPHVAVLHGRSYRAARLRWRLRVLSEHEPFDVALRDIDAVDQLQPGEWVFVGAERDPQLEARKYRRIFELTGDPRPWSVYAP